MSTTAKAGLVTAPLYLSLYPSITLAGYLDYVILNSNGIETLHTYYKYTEDVHLPFWVKMSTRERPKSWFKKLM